MIKAYLWLNGYFRNRFIIYFVVFLAIALRFFTLQTGNYWFDECVTGNYLLFMEDDFNAAIDNLIQENQMPLYYILLYFWTRLWDTEISQRFLSCIFSVLSVIVIFFLGKRLFDRNTGIIAAVILALSSFNIWYAQEARYYALSIFLCLCLVHLTFLIIDVQKKVYYALYFLVFFACFLSAHFLQYAMFISLAMLCFSKIERGYKVLFSFIYVLMLFWVVWHLWVSNTEINDSFYWVPKPTLYSLVITLNNYNLGYTAEHLSYFAALVISNFLIWAVFRNARFNLSRILVMSVFAFVPLLLTYAISHLFFPVYMDRQFSFYAPFYYLLIAFGFNKLKSIRTKIFISACFIILASFSLYNYYNNKIILPEYPYHLGVHPKKSFKSVIKHIGLRAKKEDALFLPTLNSTTIVSLIYSELDLRGLKYYYLLTENSVFYEKTASLVKKNKGQWRWIDFDSKFLNCQVIDGAGKGKMESEIREKILLDPEIERIWVVFIDWDRSTSLDQDTRQVVKFLDENCTKEEAGFIDNVFVALYINNKSKKTAPSETVDAN